VLCVLTSHKYVKTPLSEFDPTGDHYLRCRRCGHERGAPDVNSGPVIDTSPGLVRDYPDRSTLEFPSDL
jgi:hypothetical protein